MYAPVLCICVYVYMCGYMRVYTWVYKTTCMYVSAHCSNITSRESLTIATTSHH